MSVSERFRRYGESSEGVIVLSAFVCLIALKAGALLAFGPTMTPDGRGYALYADAIVAGTFTQVDLEGDAIPVVLTRPIGYPALIAGAKAVAGGAWPWAIVLIQCAASLLATAAVYRLARSFRLGLWPSLAVAAAQASAIQFAMDQAIATDSSYSTMLTIAACLLAGVVLRHRLPHLPTFLAAGALIAGSFLLRDVC
jgi:hypothetical protein